MMTNPPTAAEPADEVEFRLRPPLSDEQLNGLFAAAWPGHEPRAFAGVLSHSLAWIGAFARGELIGFVNVAWDGGAHAFLLDPTVHPSRRRRGMGTELVLRAVEVAREGGAEWLHVDYEPQLESFYRGCGFRPTAAGLIQLPVPGGRDEARIQSRVHGSAAME
jgi:GNAT superfamily N-acetyltransferase